MKSIFKILVLLSVVLMASCGGGGGFSGTPNGPSAKLAHANAAGRGAGLQSSLFLWRASHLDQLRFLP